MFLLRFSDVVHNFMKVPTKPPSNVEEVRNQYDQSLVQQLEEVGSLRDAYPMELAMLTFASTSGLGQYGRAPRCSTNSPRPKPEKSKSTFTLLSTIVVLSYDPWISARKSFCH